MIRTRTGSSFVVGLLLEACCPAKPGPPLDEITEWAHAGPAPSSDACKGTTESEPNDSVAQENPVTAANDSCDDTQIHGSIGADVDAFTFRETPCSGKAPSAKLTSTATDLRLCLFVACGEGKAGLDEHQPCGENSTVYRLDEGVEGCCSTSDEVVVHANCDSQSSIIGASPPLTGHVIVDRPGDARAGCEDYAVAVSL